MGRRRDDDPTVAGFVLIDKPAGLTSHDVVARVRKAFGVRRVGHSGTLDPAATGLLLVGVGWVTRVLRFTTELPKHYSAIIAFGTATTTMDAEGDAVATSDMAVDRSELESAFAKFTGEIDQVPPMYSALKVDGEKLYDIARRGEQVDRAPRRVVIHALKVVDDIERGPDGAETVGVDVECSSGTYVRVLADEIGRELGGFAHLRTLRRTRIGPYDVADAITLEDLDEKPGAALRPAAEATRGIIGVTVDAAMADQVRHGGRIDTEAVGELAVMGNGPVAVLDASGGLLAVFERSGDALVPACVAPATG